MKTAYLSVSVCVLGVLLAWLGVVSSRQDQGEISHADVVYVKGFNEFHIDVEGESVQARWCDQGDWQRMTIIKDAASQGIESGDAVYFKAHTGNHLSVRGDRVRADQQGLAAQARFRIEKDGARRVVSGDVVSLKAHTNKYLGVADVDVHAGFDTAQRLIIVREPSLASKLAKRWGKFVAFAKVFVARTHEHFTRSPPLQDDVAGHRRRVQQTLDAFRAMRGGQGVTLTSGVHRHVWGTTEISNAKLDLTQYVHILGVDVQARTVNVEGRAYFTDVLRHLLEEHRMTLEVIPDMVHLTLGGLYAGIGSGAAAFKFGAFHHSVLEVDVLTSDGKVLTCSPTQNADLFAALPGSVGTFGYVLRMLVRIIPAKRYVVATHTRVNSFQAFQGAMLEGMANNSLDFLDGAIYGANDCIIIGGVMSDDKPDGTQVYSLQATGVPYAKLAQQGGEHWFELLEYVYRWDPDGYFSTWETPEWTRNPWLRRLAATLLPWFHRSDWLREAFSIVWEFDLKVEGSHMYVDYVVPLGGAASHLEWFNEEVDLYPLYMAPIGLSTKPLADYILWQAEFPSIDIGVGYGPMGHYGSNKKKVIATRKKMETYLGRVEGGTRLQSTNINVGDTDAFWSLFPPGARDKYKAAKSRYDPNSVFPGIVEKLR